MNPWWLLFIVPVTALLSSAVTLYFVGKCIGLVVGETMKSLAKRGYIELPLQRDDEIAVTQNGLGR